MWSIVTNIFVFKLGIRYDVFTEFVTKNVTVNILSLIIYKVKAKAKYPIHIICAKRFSDNLREWNDVKGNLAAFHFYSFSLNTPFISCMGLLSKNIYKPDYGHAFSWICKPWMVSVDIYYILFGCYGLHIIMQIAKKSNIKSW